MKHAMGRASVEYLETRRLLASFISYDDDGTLIVTGTDGHDDISFAVTLDDAGGGDNFTTYLYVTLNQEAVRYFATNVRIHAGAGNDTIHCVQQIWPHELWGTPNPIPFAAYIEGGDGVDIITADILDDTIDAGAGDDDVFGNDGNDRMSAGDGADTVRGWNGDDLIDAGAGNDLVYGGDGGDRIASGDGDDLVSGGAQKDTIDGGLGNDRLNGNGGHDRLYGGPNADRLYGYDGNDWLDGGSSNDRLEGGGGLDSLFGQGGSDRLFSADGGEIDQVFGGKDNDTASVDPSDVLASIETTYRSIP